MSKDRNKDPVILSFEESLLRKSDVDLLYGPFWLNDNVISFYFEYLRTTFNNPRRILLVSPEVTQCIKLIPHSQVQEFLDPLEAPSKTHIFFALNDNERPTAMGGTHWSLLFYSSPDETVYHYDSSRGSNGEQARAFAKKLYTYLGYQGAFKEESCLQQSNGYDCGIYVMCYAEALVKHLVEQNNSLDEFSNLSQDLCNKAVNMRSDVALTIEKLRR